MIKLILAAIVLLGMAFAFIAIKMFFIKDAQFNKTCSSIDSNTGQSIGCSCSADERSCNN